MPDDIQEYDYSKLLQSQEAQIGQRHKKQLPGRLGTRNQVPPTERVSLEQADSEKHGRAVKKGLEQGSQFVPGLTTTGEASRAQKQNPEDIIINSEDSKTPPSSTKE